MTLNDFEPRSGHNLCPLRNFTEFSSFRDGLRKSGGKYTHTFCGRNIGHRIIIYAIYLNGVTAFTSRYFNEFAKSAFQLITGSSSIELIDQKSASVTHKAVKLVCVTKFTH